MIPVFCMKTDENLLVKRLVQLRANPPEAY